jgi:hypothetical protein
MGAHRLAFLAVRRACDLDAAILAYGEAHAGWLKHRENVSRYMAVIAKVKGGAA